MTVEFVHGDLFEVEADAIGHGTNTHGVMGAGIAKAFRAKFPRMYDEYVDYCRDGNAVPGDATAHVDGGTLVYNLFSQDAPGATATYGWLVLALSSAAGDFTQAHLSYNTDPQTLAIPLIGCGIGGLSFHDFYNAVFAVDDLYGEWFNIKVVYNDDNQHMIPEDLRGNN